MDYVFVLSIAGSLISTLFGIVLYYVRSNQKQSAQTNAKLLEATTNLRDASIELRASVGNIRSNCVDKHSVVDKRLDQHALKLSQHDMDIVTLKTQIDKDGK